MSIGTGKEVGISERTIERSLAKGRKPAKRTRRTQAKTGRNLFMTNVSRLRLLTDLGEPELSDPALALLTPDERTEAVETFENTIMLYQKVVERLKKAS